jgi:hypothetical protein
MAKRQQGTLAAQFLALLEPGGSNWTADGIGIDDLICRFDATVIAKDQNYEYYDYKIVFADRSVLTRRGTVLAHGYHGCWCQVGAGHEECAEALLRNPNWVGSREHY